MRTRFLCSLFLLLVLVSFTPVSTGQVDTTAVIAAWNLSGFGSIEAERIPNLARALADIDAEVVALSEVNPDSVVNDLVLELSKLGAAYSVKIIDQTANLNLAILYKAGVFVTEEQLIEDSDDGSSGLRKALVADVRVGQFDFKIIALHLKSGRSADSRTIRTRQNEVIADFIETATTGDEKDVLILGDYNMVPGQDAENFDALSPTDLLRFISTEELNGQISRISNPDTGSGNLLDGYAISRDHTGEYIEKSIVIVPLPEILQVSLADYVEDYSDHFPLAARFRITVDDD